LKITKISVSRDVKEDDEEGLRIKEQAILDLASILCQTKKATGKILVNLLI